MTTKKGPEALDVSALDAVTGGTGLRTFPTSDGSGSGDDTTPGPGGFGLLNPGMLPDVAANTPVGQPPDRGTGQPDGGEEEGPNGNDGSDILYGTP